MVANVSQLIGVWDLLLAWTGRIIRGRYQQSLLGWFWAVIQPAASAAIFTIIFTWFVPIDTGHIPYVVFSYTALVPWTLFAAALADMAASLTSNMGLVTKIYFPREVLPIAALLARLMDFAVASVLLIILMIYFQVPIFLPGLFYLPIIMGVQLLLLLGLGLFLSAVNVFYRDVDPMLKLFIQIWFYASPIIYPISTVPERFRNLYFLNPMAGVLEAYRDVLLRGVLPGSYLIPSALMACAIFLFGYWFFKRVEYLFADIV